MESGEADGAGRHRVGEYSAAGRSNPRASGEGAGESERLGTKEAGEHGLGASEGCGADVVKRLTRTSRAGVFSAGRGEGVDEPGRGFPDAIVG